MMESAQQLGAVLLVLGLLALSVYGMRSKRLPGLRSESRNSKRLQIVERVPLTPQHTLCLVRVDDRELMITTAPGNCQVVPALNPQS